MSQPRSPAPYRSALVRFRHRLGGRTFSEVRVDHGLIGTALIGTTVIILADPPSPSPSASTVTFPADVAMLVSGASASCPASTARSSVRFLRLPVLVVRSVFMLRPSTSSARRPSAPLRAAIVRFLSAQRSPASSPRSDRLFLSAQRSSASSPRSDHPLPAARPPLNLLGIARAPSSPLKVSRLYVLRASRRNARAQLHAIVRRLAEDRARSIYAALPWMRSTDRAARCSGT